MTTSNATTGTVRNARLAKWMVAAVAVGSATVATAGGYYDSAYGGYGRGNQLGAGAYVGMNLGLLQYSENGLGSITPGLALLRIGVPISPNLAFEGRAGAGLGNSSSDGNSLSLQSLYGAYVKGSLPLAPGFALYGVGGVAGVNLRRDFGASSTNDTGLSFGVGADLNLGNGASVNVEWTRLPGGNDLGYDYNSSMASLGLTWHF